MNTTFASCAIGWTEWKQVDAILRPSYVTGREKQHPGLWAAPQNSPRDHSMHNDLGYFDMDTLVLEPLENH
jgi:hypothetical protein